MTPETEAVLSIARDWQAVADGKKAIGRIYGAVQPAILISGSMGALSGGLLFDLTGDYNLFFNICIALTLASAFLFLMAKPPIPPGGQAHLP